ncbi:hypothetical protein BDV95DRAFT_492161 [Massariosphaeria phaeospora]|uniref:Uncharacterized protein n=1 Tax=Massariosphaeria phaeospora TaxID=100035 RepID=A0A7C8ICK7_9PLEO|nr:hypothetical protein BDV95DRAFT_492161 [Massariosphaeria phaeospora]
MPSFALLRVPAHWVLFMVANAAAQMPYNPTRILRNGSLLYIFQPSSSAPLQFELGSVDISARISASELPYNTLYPALPFLDSNIPRAFNPVLDKGGNITVYTGDCAKGASAAEVWSFTPESSEKSGNGTWKQEDVSSEADAKNAAAIGPNYLSDGMSFSAVVEGDEKDTGAYYFGGMCPSQDEDNGDWQSAANYSNYMVTLEPAEAKTGPLNYQLGASTSRGPPIAEAGFTLTGLSPSFSNRSDGTQTQQQNFVLVGGHTSTAFINMSQVALFSLPQQGWTFVPVSQPDTSRTDLAIRTDVQEIEPRSGHSAVLTPDGQRLVIFGGWIGDIDTPADPLLAILSVGDGYGGEGNWEWSVPTTTGTLLPSDAGVYGHGAAMLPGGVMLIKGGYSIPKPASRRRRAEPIANTKTLFFNVTSNSWITEYSPPEGISPPPEVKTGPLSTASQKAGLGVGLGVGMAAVLSLLTFYIWYTRRTKKQRDTRAKELNDLAMSTHRYNLGCLAPGIDGRGGQSQAMDCFDDPNDTYFYPTSGQAQSAGRHRNNGQDAERTGLLVEVPSPTRGLRRSLGGRPPQQMARYDERRVRGSGHIHSIDELEEEPEEDVPNDATPLTSQPEMSEQPTKQGASIFDNVPLLDPFTDKGRRGDELAALRALPPRRSSPTSNGRLSPTKSHSERTGSNLSERSTRSNLSSHSASGSLARTASIRSAALLNAVLSNPFQTPEASPTSDQGDRNGAGEWQNVVDPRTGSITSMHSNGRPTTASGDTDSFTTARGSFMHLQAEGEALLGGNPDRDRARPGTSSTSGWSNPYSHRDTETTMSRNGTTTAATSVIEGPTRKSGVGRKSWLGSVRRVLTRSITTTEARTRSLTTSTPHFESYTDDPLSAIASSAAGNRRSFPASSPPRRAASDASFWRSRRGKQDWLDEEIDPSDPRARWRRNSGDDWGAPEDEALAEEERQRRKWRERSTLINLGDEDLPTPHSPIHGGELGVPGVGDRPSTPADEDDWDVEAAVERRVVQVMFTVPKSKLRVVNADVDRSSLLSLPRDTGEDSNSKGEPGSSSPGRVKDIAGRFEQLSTPVRGSPRTSPAPSPAPSIKSVKIRNKGSAASLATRRKVSAPKEGVRGME